jgi:hypothetical protein
MQFGDIDISILFFLLDNPDKTTFDIAKNIFVCKTSELRKKDALVRFHLQEMERGKIILCAPKRPKTYNVNPEHVFSGTGILRIKANGGGLIRVNFGDFLVITDNKTYMQINRIERNGKTNKTVKIIA